MPHAHARPTAATQPFLTAEASASLAEIGAATPEWRPWVALLETALGEADGDDWRLADIRFAHARPADAPLLEGTRLLVGGPAASRTVDALMTLALPGCASPDPLALVEAAIAQDTERIGAMADLHGCAAATLDTIAHFAAIPILLEAGRRAAAAIPKDWARGYCPVCGAWPTLAELRGLERRRVLRCGRCSTGWERGVLHCPFCDERDHRRQGGLTPEEGGEFVRIETCESCRGYLKVLTTLRAKPAWGLAVEDLRTRPLEVAALDRGFRRPDRPGWQVTAAVAPRPESV